MFFETALLKFLVNPLSFDKILKIIVDFKIR